MIFRSHPPWIKSHSPLTQKHAPAHVHAQARVRLHAREGCPMAVDHRLLLAKYIELVGSEEGVTFVSRAREPDFTAE